MKRYLMKILMLSSLWTILLLGHNSMAQNKDAAVHGDDMSGRMGYILPNQIEGVTEIMPMWGIGYGKATSFGVLDFDFFNANASGANFSIFSLSGVAEMPPIEDVVGIIYGGPQVSMYIPDYDTGRRFVFGVHAGIGAVTNITEVLLFRTDLRMNFSPGTSLFLGFSIILRSSLGSGK